jgi:hypothetical protein
MTAFLQVCGKDVCMETLLSIQALARLPWQLPLLQPSQGGLQSMHSTAQPLACLHQLPVSKLTQGFVNKGMSQPGPVSGG